MADEQNVTGKMPDVVPTTETPSTPQQVGGQQQQIQVNVDYLKTTRVHICMPCYGGMLTESTFMSYIKWSNTMVAKFLANPDSTHLMFVDADIGWEPWHLLVMLNRDVDVIGGLYPMKSLPIKWCVNGFDGAEEGADGLQEVSKTGTGFFLVKRHVFDKLNAHPATKPFINDIGLPVELNPYMKTYFDTAVRENRYYSEDWTFCENWRDLGGRVWVDKRVLLRHTGTYTFAHEAQEKLITDVTPMVEARQAAARAAAVPAPAETKVLASNKKASKKK